MSSAAAGFVDVAANAVGSDGGLADDDTRSARDPSVTLNVYADAIPDDDGRALVVFSRAVWGL